MNKKQSLSSVILIFFALSFVTILHGCQRFIFNSARAEINYKNKVLTIGLISSDAKTTLNYRLLLQFLKDHQIQLKIKNLNNAELIKKDISSKSIDLAIVDSESSLKKLTWKMTNLVGPQSADFDSKSLIIFSTQHQSLTRLFEVWFNQKLASDQLLDLKIQWMAEKFNLTTEHYKNVMSDIDLALPSYKKYFQKYGKQYEIPWTLLAAVAYQESKWKNNARSYTGVRGLMQITEKTAIFLGIKDRTDPEESIKGAAIYLNYLFHKTSPKLSSKQRWAKTLAAYNIGWAHILDLKNWASKNNKNFESWEQIRSILPIKQNLEITHELKRGYARGNETIRFVENVNVYYKILNEHFINETQEKSKWPTPTTIAMVKTSLK